MLIKRKKKYYSTTDSSNGDNRYKNLIKEKAAERINQVYLSDITYIRTKKGFRYLALVTDEYSRKIVGHSTGESITTELCIEAIEMAVKTSGNSVAGIIHHSDQGSQYCSNMYRDLMEAYEIIQSMSRRGSPYENAKAERVIGTLKREYLLGQTFTDDRYLRQMIEEAVSSYNNMRPHLSLGYLTPDELYYKEVGSNTPPATPSGCYFN